MSTYHVVTTLDEVSDQGCNRGDEGERVHPLLEGGGEKGPYLPMKNLLCPHMSMGYEWGQGDAHCSGEGWNWYIT